MDEQEEQKKVEKVKPIVVETEGTVLAPIESIDRANAAAQRMEEATKKLEEQNNRQESLMARQAIAGKAEAGIVEEPPKKMTDSEYAQALMRGEVNPLKEDGIR